MSFPHLIPEGFFLFPFCLILVVTLTLDTGTRKYTNLQCLMKITIPVEMLKCVLSLAKIISCFRGTSLGYALILETDLENNTFQRKVPQYQLVLLVFSEACCASKD